MNTDNVPVTVEWALWGMEPRDIAHSVLRCSDGILGPEVFDRVLTRYSPGMLEDLPQVTVSWISDGRRQNYVVLSIHEAQERDPYDTDRRDVVSTRCFCMPYAELASGAVSYQAMYEVLRKIPIPVDRQSAIKTELPVLRPEGPSDPLATRVAALLLTCRPVCILGAGEAVLAERLRFLDSVMSLLPYGLRSRLSATTWASSFFYEHKFRLFFSSAPRQADDYIVAWDQRDHPQIEHPDADGYLSWLANDTRDHATELVKLTDPMAFSQPEVSEMLKQLYASAGSPPARDRSGGNKRAPAAEPAGAPVVEALLIDCAEKIRGNAPGLAEPAINQLSDHRNHQVTPEQRQRLRAIIKENQLLQKDLPVKSQLRAALYAILLQLAFETPLTYQGYCQLEDCAVSEPGQQMHRSLLLAVESAEISDFCVRMLVLRGRGEEGLKAALDPVPPGALIVAAADRRLRREHARLVYEIAVRNLAGRASRLDERVLREELTRRAYLAPRLREIYPGQFEYQVNELCQILRLAYRGGLNRPAIQEILGNIHFAPTAALFVAVLTIASPEDAEPLERAFTRSLLGRPNYAGRPRRQLVDELYGDDQPDAGQDTARPSPVRPGRTQRFWVRRPHLR